MAILVLFAALCVFGMISWSAVRKEPIGTRILYIISGVVLVGAVLSLTGKGHKSLKR